MPSVPHQRNLAAALLLVTMFVLPHAVSANGVGATEGLTALDLNELSSIKVVAAAKKEQQITSVAASAQVISRQEIRRYGYRTVGEALRRVSGMYLSSDRNYDYLGTRGFSVPGDYNTRVLVLIDGHRSNTPLYDQSFMEDGFPVDIESIERIEVVKGPGSALWGSNALLGVINVITRKGNDIRGGRLVAEAGSHQRRKGYLEYGDIFANGLAVAGGISSLDSAGEHQIYFPELDQPGFNNGLAVDMDGEEAYKGYLTLSFKDFGLRFITSKRSKTVPPAAWDGAFNDRGGYTVDQTTSCELNYGRDLLIANNGHLTARLYHDSFDYYGDYPYYDGGGWSGTYIVNKDEGAAKQWGGELRFKVDPEADLSLTAGLEYVDVYRITQKNWDAPPAYSLALDTEPGANAYSTSAGYLQGEYNLVDHLILIAGGRYDDYSTFGGTWSTRVALLYSPRLATTFKLLYGEAFRAPNDYERNYSDGYSMVGNNGLVPENIHTLEVVCEQNFGNHTRLVASLFRFELHNLITQTTIAGDLLQFQNNPHTVRSDGAELQVETRLQNGLTGFLSLSTQNTEDRTTGGRLDNSPTFLAAGGVSMPLWSKRLYLTPELRYIGKRSSSATGETIGAETVTNLTLTAGRLLDQLDISMSIYNLFDRATCTPGAGEHYHYDPDTDTNIPFDIPQDGRTFRLQLSYRF